MPGGVPQAEVVDFLCILLGELGRRMQELIDSCPEVMLAAMCDSHIKSKLAVRSNALTLWRDRLIQRVHQRERQTSRLLEGEEEEEDHV